MKEEIREFLAENANVPAHKLTDALDLFDGEIWDSLLIVRFFAFAKERFGVDIDLSKITENKIRTISALDELLTAGPRAK